MVVVTVDGGELEVGLLEEEVELVGEAIMVGGFGDGALGGAAVGGGDVVGPGDVEGLVGFVEVVGGELEDGFVGGGIGELAFEGEFGRVGGVGDGEGVDQVDEKCAVWGEVFADLFEGGGGLTVAEVEEGVVGDDDEGETAVSTMLSVGVFHHKLLHICFNQRHLI